MLRSPLHSLHIRLCCYNKLSNDVALDMPSSRHDIQIMREAYPYRYIIFCTRHSGITGCTRIFSCLHMNEVGLYISSYFSPLFSEMLISSCIYVCINLHAVCQLTERSYQSLTLIQQYIMTNAHQISCLYMDRDVDMDINVGMNINIYSLVTVNIYHIYIYEYIHIGTTYLVFFLLCN